MAHTPGPWAYDTDSKEVFASNEQHSCGWIALVKGNDSYAQPLAADMQAANARLIAAAPELLEALERLVDYVFLNKDDDAVSYAEYVIAKAEGRAT